MVADVRAVTPDQYTAWIAKQKANIQAANTAVAASHTKLAADPQATP
jgi:heme/copper-type cytochrome/quinol oxidase subunit 2